jgi:hypothetical protein
MKSRQVISDSLNLSAIAVKPDLGYSPAMQASPQWDSVAKRAFDVLVLAKDFRDWTISLSFAGPPALPEVYFKFKHGDLVWCHSFSKRNIEVGFNSDEILLAGEIAGKFQAWLSKGSPKV